MARGDQLSRQWKIIHILLASNYGKSVPDLARALECTPRTVYRDLDALQAGGFPITTSSRGNRRFWHILGARNRQMPMTVSIPELMALYFSRDLLQTYRGTFVYEAVESLLAKIKATLAPEYITYLDRLQNRLDAGPAPRKDYAAFGPILSELNTAIIDEKIIHMVYYSMGRQARSHRTVHPYRLRHVEDSLYLIGYCGLRHQVRIFAVDRIKAITVTRECFQMPEGFDLQGFLEDSFGIYQGPPTKVKIRFSPSVAGYIRERTWHRSQELEEEQNGSLVFTAVVAGIEEISHWVLRWGAEAEVLAPIELRRIVGRHAKAMAARYPNAEE
jgi:predicted DNA-binding transcriptional regulator YafY